PREHPQLLLITHPAHRLTAKAFQEVFIQRAVALFFGLLFKNSGRLAAPGCRNRVLHCNSSGRHALPPKHHLTYPRLTLPAGAASGSLPLAGGPRPALRDFRSAPWRGNHLNLIERLQTR
ncbi:hypothetical protein SAMN05920897_1411, partial [Alkalispirochaeta americana]